MESNTTYIISRFQNYSSIIPNDYYIKPISVLLVGFVGMVGNGTVIWILGCHMKRNPFTIYILNLSIADFGVLTTVAAITIYWTLPVLHFMIPFILTPIVVSLFLFTFSASQFLLAIISIDRCVCLFFPLWYRFRRPSHFSTTVCVTIWIFTFLVSVVFIALDFSVRPLDLIHYQFLLNAVLFMPAMFISATAMLIKVYFVSPHHKRGKLLTAVLLALLFFLFFPFPINVLQLICREGWGPVFHFDYFFFIGTTLNSAINPVIYFLVGRDKKAQSWGRIKKIFEKLFQEEEFCREEVENPLETHL